MRAVVRGAIDFEGMVGYLADKGLSRLLTLRAAPKIRTPFIGTGSVSPQMRSRQV